MHRVLAVSLILLSAMIPPSFGAKGGAWQAAKCQVYEEAWTHALEAFGSDNLNYNFMASNENFIASGCLDPVQVCPRSAQEIEIANFLTLAAMNAGAASTFLPFGCEE